MKYLIYLYKSKFSGEVSFEFKFTLMTVMLHCVKFQLIWMLHAQSRLINDVELMQAGAIKDFLLAYIFFP